MASRGVFTPFAGSGHHDQWWIDFSGVLKDGTILEVLFGWLGAILQNILGHQSINQADLCPCPLRSEGQSTMDIFREHREMLDGNLDIHHNPNPTSFKLNINQARIGMIL